MHNYESALHACICAHLSKARASIIATQGTTISVCIAAGSLDALLGSKLSVIGVANTKNMLIAGSGIYAQWREKLLIRGPGGVSAFVF